MTAWSPLIRALVRSKFCEEEMSQLVSHVHLSTRSESSPLHYAVLRRDVRFVQFLLHHGVDVDVRNIFMETPLHWAVKQGHLEVVSFLVSSGAQVDAVDTEGLSPRDWAIEEDQTHLLSLLKPPSKPAVATTSLEGRPSRSHSDPLPRPAFSLLR